MESLSNADRALFRWINDGLANPVFDQVMPWLSGNSLFFPLAILLGVLVVVKGRLRGAIFVGVLLITLGIGDSFVVRTLKNVLDVPRPANALEGVHLLTGIGSHGSMPSGHAANWFSAAFVAFIFYRKSLWILFPLALLVGFSRIYNGAHFPSDVVVGALVGCGYAAAIAWSLRYLWSWAGQRWFPLWWERMADLFNPPAPRSPDEEEEEMPLRPPAGFRAPSKAATLKPRHMDPDRQWLYMGYIVIAVLMLVRLAYISRPAIELSEDEAYQWVWSKHLALSYYSKPPLIAYTQFLGTTLWGDTELGVRFFSPVISAVLALLVLRFFAREVNARAGFFLVLMCSATPLLAAGSVLMTIDPLSVLFWTAATLAGWRAVQETSTWKEWAWVGLWMGLGFLSKYVQLLQLVCWAVFFVLWAPARKQLRRPGPYLALLINALATLPVIIWNSRNHWVTAQHVAGNAAMDEPWKPTLKYLGEFLGAELGLLNPVFFVAAIWAAIAFWRLGRKNPRLVYFFSMGAPLFLIYLLFTLHSRVLPNWIAPSVVPLFCLMTMHWDTRWRLGPGKLKSFLIAGLIVGFAIVLVCHETDLVKAVTGQPMPLALDPLRRVRGWKQTAEAAEQARHELLKEGKPVFIIGSHYGITGEISFYSDEAREAVRTTPLVYSISSPRPRNQFHFWPGYDSRKGENAIFIREVDWKKQERRPLPPQLEQEFESVTDLGTMEIKRKGRVLRTVELYACRGLR